MLPRKLDPSEESKNWTDSHEENCRRVKARLLELNPGYNVFIYWQSIGGPSTDALRRNEWVDGKFHSKPGGKWYTYGYTYYYYVFVEGIIVWHGSNAADKLCFTDTNYEQMGSEYRFQITTRPKVQWANWMGQLRAKLGGRSSQLYLSSLALPSTHNSHALASNIFSGLGALPLKLLGLHGYAASFAECQTHTVREQLDMGVRSLDFRVGTGLKLRHGKVELKGHLEDVVKVMSEWLDMHNQETILFQAKWDNEPYSDELRINTVKEVNQLLQRYPRALIQKEQPTLSECVGKMVLYNDNGFGPWQPQYYESPSFEPPSSGDINKHCEYVFHALESILPQLDVSNKIFYDVGCGSETLSHLKLWGKGWKWDVARPIAFVDRLKTPLLWWLMEHRGGRQNQGRKARLGRLNMDFVDHRLANEIVLWNFDEAFI